MVVSVNFPQKQLTDFMRIQNLVTSTLEIPQLFFNVIKPNQEDY